MSNDRLTHLDDATLLRDLAHLVAQDRVTTATLLAHIAEVDARRLYLPAAYSSMFAYCVGELGFSEDAAAKRIQAARVARAYPRLFEDVAAGRLHMAAVCLLAPHLNAENVDELVAAATHRRKADIEAWLSSRFPPPAGVAGPPARVTALRARGRAGVDVAARASALAPAAGPALAFEAPQDSLEATPPSVEAAAMSNQHAPSMKTGCQRYTCSHPRPSLTSRLFGVDLPPQVSLREQGPTRGTGLKAHRACRDHLLVFSVRLR